MHFLVLNTSSSRAFQIGATVSLCRLFIIIIQTSVKVQCKPLRPSVMFRTYAVPVPHCDNNEKFIKVNINQSLFEMIFTTNGINSFIFLV